MSEGQKVMCCIEGCLSVFETSEPVLGSARFICRHHPRSEQVRAAGREYDERLDEVDKTIRFQDYQFDKEIPRPVRLTISKEPEVTTLDQDDKH